MIPVTVIVVTKNEEENIAHCLLPLVTSFERVIVVDSDSSDDTVKISKSMGAETVLFNWSGVYPKKRAWCLENIIGIKDWVFFCDADEIISPKLLREIRLLFARDQKYDGYFIKGAPVWMHRKLKFGMTNNKLCLFRKSCFAFPPINDLDIPGMGEIEGHYQPVPLKEGARIGQLRHAITHHNRNGRDAWFKKHKNYAVWEGAMIARRAFPRDPLALRQLMKDTTRDNFLRPYLMFLYSYIVKLGFLDGVAGFDYALARMGYARDVLRELRKCQ